MKRFISLDRLDYFQRKADQVLKQVLGQMKQIPRRTLLSGLFLWPAQLSKNDMVHSGLKPTSSLTLDCINLTPEIKCSRTSFASVT